jgi:hypothetical protein
MGTSTPGAWPPSGVRPSVRPPNRRRRGVLAGAVAALLLSAGAVWVWASDDPDGYRTSRNGCVTVTVASSTGGAMRHECGDAARAWCRSAYADNDALALATRTQCQLAGLPRDAVAGP